MSIFSHDYRLSKETQLARVKQNEYDRSVKRLRKIADMIQAVSNKRERMIEQLYLVVAQGGIQALNGETIKHLQEFVVKAFPLDEKLVEEESKLFEKLEGMKQGVEI